MNDTTWKSSPLSAIREPVTAPDTLSEGPVKFLLVSGQLDDGRWGLVGAYWVSIDGSRLLDIGSNDAARSVIQIRHRFAEALIRTHEPHSNPGGRELRGLGETKRPVGRLAPRAKGAAHHVQLLHRNPDAFDPDGNGRAGRPVGG